MERLNGKDGDVKIGGVVVLDVSAWSLELDTPLEEFDGLNSAPEVMYLGTTKGTGDITGLRNISDPAQAAVYSNVVTVNDGSPEAPGVETEPAYELAEVTLYENSGRAVVFMCALTGIKFGAEKGKFQAISWKMTSSGEIKQYTGMGA